MPQSILNTFWQSPVVILILIIFSVCVGLCPLSHRKKGRAIFVCMAGGAFVFLLFFFLTFLFVDTSNASTTLEPIFCFLAGFLLGWLILRIPAQISVFIAVWGQILAELAAQLLIPTMNRVMGTGTVQGKCFHLLCIGLTMVFLFLMTRFFLFPLLTRDGEYRMNQRKTVRSLVALAVFLVLSNYQLIFFLLGEGGVRSGTIVPVFRLVVGVSALLYLYLQNANELQLEAERELYIVRQLQLSREEQYRISKENIDLINQKCHDLKHQIAALRSLRDADEIDRQISEMEKAVMIYDSAIKTGNTALDVVLTEKSLLCEANGINLTCLVDGRSLDFVKVVDLYSMFGNALDNAIESVMKEEDRQKRVIQVVGYREQNFLLIRVRNYCENPPVLVDDLPLTTKEENGYHGFGIKSIRATAEKYGGEIAIETGACFFSLQILLPVQST